MKRYDFWKLSLRNVAGSPIRSLLTVLGMAIGVGAILAVLTLGDAGKTQVESEMVRLGIDRVWLTSGESGSLRQGDGARLAQALQTQVTEQSYLYGEVANGEYRTQAVIVGCEPEHAEQSTLVEGRFLWPAEWSAQGQSVLLGEKLAAELKLHAGDRISICRKLFRVAGVIRQNRQSVRVDGDTVVFMPLEGIAAWTGNGVQEMTIAVGKNQRPVNVAQQAIEALRSLTGREAQATTMQAQVEAAESVIEIFVNVLAWIACICILVGGVGVMNILLVSVRERRREIGVMKSLGASEKQICLMFLMEAVLYAAIGGVTGVLIGFGIIRMASGAIGLRTNTRASDVAAVFSAAVAIGLFFGVSPALRASRMSPVDALRE